MLNLRSAVVLTIFDVIRFFEMHFWQKKISSVSKAKDHKIECFKHAFQFYQFFLSGLKKGNNLICYSYFYT